MDIIKGKTLFILGAGASTCFGFPTGNVLYNKIHNGDYTDLYEEFLDSVDISESKKERKLIEAKELAKTVSLATNKSVDFFLSNNSQFLDRGKEAISLIMLKQENEIISDEFEINLDDDWLSLLFQKGIEYFRNVDQYPEDQISFITFNYERSLEFFLHQKLIHSFTQVSPYELESKLNQIQIHHVYGKIGNLPWQNESEYGELEFGCDHTEILLTKIRDAIKLMYLERYGSKDLSELKMPIQDANRIFFLGFSYDPDNIEILGVNEILRETQGKTIYGTAMGIPERRVMDLRKSWGRNHVVYLEKEMNCKNLLFEYL